MTELPGEATEAAVKLAANEVLAAEAPADPKTPGKTRAPKRAKRGRRPNGKVPVRRGAREVNAGIEMAASKAGKSKGAQAAFYSGVVAGLLFARGLLNWRDMAPGSAKLKRAMVQSVGKARAT